jgi:hypothetical protein
VMVNDGTKQYDHQHDGSSQIQGSCIRDFRNKPLPVKLKIEYVNQVLTVRTMIKVFFFIIKFSFRFILIMEYHKMILHMNSVRVLIEYNYLKLVILV